MFALLYYIIIITIALLNIFVKRNKINWFVKFIRLCRLGQNKEKLSKNILYFAWSIAQIILFYSIELI